MTLISVNSTHKVGEVFVGTRGRDNRSSLLYHRRPERLQVGVLLYNGILVPEYGLSLLFYLVDLLLQLLGFYLAVRIVFHPDNLYFLHFLIGGFGSLAQFEWLSLAIF